MGTTTQQRSNLSVNRLKRSLKPVPPHFAVIREIIPLRSWIATARRAGETIGLVPTMGALHMGHLSLVKRAKRECDRVITTIFVNPTQFGPREDLNRYPRTLESDLEMLASAGCDVAFVPANDEIYPPGCSTFVDPPAVANALEGECRPGHFRGVATVVLKLFGIAPVDAAYFGQKDYQQAVVIERMVADLNVPLRIVVCPIAREPDGLALSSRNRYLSADERERAVALSQSLRALEEQVAAGEQKVTQLLAAWREQLAPQVDRIEYVAVCDRQSLEPLEKLDRPAVALVAAFVGKTRLIDNVLLLPVSQDPSP